MDKSFQAFSFRFFFFIFFFFSYFFGAVRRFDRYHSNHTSIHRLFLRCMLSRHEREYPVSLTFFLYRGGLRSFIHVAEVWNMKLIQHQRQSYEFIIFQYLGRLADAKYISIHSFDNNVAWSIIRYPRTILYLSLSRTLSPWVAKNAVRRDCIRGCQRMKIAGSRRLAVIGRIPSKH